MGRPLVTDFGHLILRVRETEEALRLYRDTLGLEVIEEPSSSLVWKVLRTPGGELTLYRSERVVPWVLPNSPDSALNLQVASVEEAAAELELRGYRVERRGRHSGILIDPWDNRIGLHDHRED